VVEAMVVDLAEAMVAAVVKGNKNQRKRAKITIKSSESRETQPKKKLRKSLKRWQSNTIQIKMQMIQKEPKRNFRK
jgi:hypothetical protein